MKNTDLPALVQAVEQLIQRNTELRAQNKSLREERGQLIEKNQIADRNSTRLNSSHRPQ